MLNEPKAIPEDLMLELEESIKKCQDIAEENLETCLRVFRKINAINERNMTAEWLEEDRQMRQDYQGSIRC